MVADREERERGGFTSSFMGKHSGQRGDRHGAEKERRKARRQGVLASHLRCEAPHAVARDYLDW
uniref:Uncharacterized protein n=1 Tax=Oryza punctata TaxID=4537 RepID=A0A1V1H0R4_ORYPU|nr:hypothetical protein [Oryza punctata]